MSSHACMFLPGVEQRGARASWTDELDDQVPPAVVRQGEPGLDVLKWGHETVFSKAGIHTLIDY